MVEAFTQHLAAFRRPKTVEAYISAAQRLDRFLQGRPVVATTLEDFAVWLVNEGLAPASVTLHVVGARTYLDFRRKRGDPIPQVETPRLPRIKVKVQAVLRGEDLRRYMRACADIMPEPYRSLCRLLPLTGFRVSEACNLTVGDLRPRAPHLYILIRDGKGDDREPQQLPAAARLLKHYLKEVRPTLPKSDRPPRDQFIFPARNGRAVRPGRVRRWIAKVNEHLGLPALHPHLMRHTYSTMLHEAGVSPFLIAHNLGHRDLRTTNRYVDKTAAAASLARVVVPE